MSRRPRPSTSPKPPRRRPARGRNPKALLDGAVSAFVSSIRKDGAGIASNADPLEAELLASGILSMWHPAIPGDVEPLEILGSAVLQRLARQRDPDTLAVLLAIAATASPPFDKAARAAVERVREAGIPEPIWSRTIGRPALVDAWISTDELDDQSNLLAAFAYDHRPPHALNLIIDANFQGLIRSAFVANDPDKVRREWTSVSGLPIRPLSEQALADLVGRGIEMFDLYLDPPVSDEGRQLMPLVRSRLRLLPVPRSIEPPVMSERKRRALVAAFGKSPEAAGLEPDEHGPLTDLARWFIDFACDYGAGDPLRWSPIAVEILLADWLPRKAIMEPNEVEALAEVLRRFVRFSARRKGLSDAVIAETLESIERFAPEYLAGMADDERAGPAKQLVRDMRAAGIDLTDHAAVQRWIDEQNARPGPPG